MSRQRHLGARVVDGIEHRVAVVFQQLRYILRRDEILDRAHLAVGIDKTNARGHCRNLGLAEGVTEGVQLAVDIGFSDVVEVDQRKMADGVACERFRRP